MKNCFKPIQRRKLWEHILLKHLNYQSRVQKKWFDNNCHTAKRKSHLTRKICNTNKMNENYESLGKANKHYKIL